MKIESKIHAKQKFIKLIMEHCYLVRDASEALFVEGIVQAADEAEIRGKYKDDCCSVCGARIN